MVDVSFTLVLCVCVCVLVSILHTLNSIMGFKHPNRDNTKISISFIVEIKYVKN